MPREAEDTSESDDRQNRRSGPRREWVEGAIEHRFGVHHPPNTMARCAQMWMGSGSSPRFSIGLIVGASDSARTVRASLSTLARLMLR